MQHARSQRLRKRYYTLIYTNQNFTDMEKKEHFKSATEIFRAAMCESALELSDMMERGRERVFCNRPLLKGHDTVDSTCQFVKTDKFVDCPDFNKQRGNSSIFATNLLIMNKELYGNELWAEIKQTSCNLCYLDELRAGKARMEPYFKGLIAMVAAFSAVTSFTGPVWAASTVVIVTSLLTAIPLFFPSLLPTAADFSEMDVLRIKIKSRLTELEQFSQGERGEAEYDGFVKTKQRHAPVETEAAALFGKISKRINRRAIKQSELYLDRFTSF
jgi:hypothetical protein